MKDLNEIFNNALKICDVCGIPYGEIERIVPYSGRANIWGRCSKHCLTNRFVIEISKKLLDENVSYEATITTVLHEIIHTAPGCFKHTGLWKQYAEKVNAMTGFNIKRTSSYEEKGISEEVANINRLPVKYIVTCENCGHDNYYRKWCHTLDLVRDQIPNAVRCGRCGCDQFNLKYL